MCMALDCSSFDDIAAKIESYLKMQPPQGIMGKIKTLLSLKEVAQIMPKKVKSAPCQEKVFTPAPAKLVQQG